MKPPQLVTFFALLSVASCGPPRTPGRQPKTGPRNNHVKEYQHERRVRPACTAG